MPNLDPSAVAAYDQVSAFFDPRIKLTVAALVTGLERGLGPEECFVSATRAFAHSLEDPSTLACLAGLLAVRMAEAEVSRAKSL